MLLTTTSVRNVWKHKKRICNLILGLKGLNKTGNMQDKNIFKPQLCMPLSIFIEHVVGILKQAGILGIKTSIKKFLSNLTD